MIPDDMYIYIVYMRMYMYIQVNMNASILTTTKNGVIFQLLILMINYFVNIYMHVYICVCT